MKKNNNNFVNCICVVKFILFNGKSEKINAYVEAS